MHNLANQEAVVAQLNQHIKPMQIYVQPWQIHVTCLVYLRQAFHLSSESVDFLHSSGADTLIVCIHWKAF